MLEVLDALDGEVLISLLAGVGVRERAVSSTERAPARPATDFFAKYASWRRLYISTTSNYYTRKPFSGWP